MNRNEPLSDTHKQTIEVVPVPQFTFENQQVKPARLRATVQIEQGKMTQLEVELLLKTPQQVHAFQGFLSQFEPVEAIQALAYFPDLELRLIFEAKSDLVDFLHQKQITELQAQHFQKNAQPSPLTDLSRFYTFQQYESVPIESA